MGRGNSGATGTGDQYTNEQLLRMPPERALQIINARVNARIQAINPEQARQEVEEARRSFRQARQAYNDAQSNYTYWIDAARRSPSVENNREVRRARQEMEQAQQAMFRAMERLSRAQARRAQASR